MVGFALTAFYIPDVVDWQIPDELRAALAQAETAAVLTPAGVTAESDGLIRPDVVWFGELLPNGILKEAEAAVRNASVFVSVGTSGTVFPAASLAQAAPASGAFLVEINPEPSEQPDFFDVVLRGPSGTVPPAINERLGIAVTAPEKWQTRWLGDSRSKRRWRLDRPPTHCHSPDENS